MPTLREILESLPHDDARINDGATTWDAPNLIDTLNDAETPDEEDYQFLVERKTPGECEVGTIRAIDPATGRATDPAAYTVGPCPVCRVREIASQIKTWTPDESVETLRDLFREADKLHGATDYDDRADITYLIDATDLPTADKPAFIDPNSPVWAMDNAGDLLIGETMDEIISIEEYCEINPPLDLTIPVRVLAGRGDLSPMQALAWWLCADPDGPRLSHSAAGLALGAAPKDIATHLRRVERRDVEA